MINANQLMKNMFEKYPEIKYLDSKIYDAADMIIKCYKNKNKLLICGNGGSSSDADHIVGELMKGFLKKRPVGKDIKNLLKKDWKEKASYLIENLQGSLPAISLSSQTSLNTAFCNDMEPDMVFAQQVMGYGRKGDILAGLSTSGNSKNVVNAVMVAKSIGIFTIGMTGKSGGMLKNICDILINVPSEKTYRIQEYHLPIYHAICALVEEEFFII